MKIEETRTLRGNGVIVTLDSKDGKTRVRAIVSVIDVLGEVDDVMDRLATLRDELNTVITQVG